MTELQVDVNGKNVPAWQTCLSMNEMLACKLRDHEQALVIESPTPNDSGPLAVVE